MTTKIVFIGDHPQAQPVTIDQTLDQLREQWCDQAQRFSECAMPTPIGVTSGGRPSLINPMAIALAWAEPVVEVDPTDIPF